MLRSMSLTVLVVLLMAMTVTSQSHPPRSLSCKAWMKNKPSLPCLEVPRCSYTNTTTSNNALLTKKINSKDWNMENYATVDITESATGSGPGKSTTSVELCFDDLNLYLNVHLDNQFYLTNETQYTTCNDAIYNENVFETFIVPYMEKEPHCYNELDISPNDVMFEAGIYNPNLNHTGIVGHPMSCEDSGVQHSTEINTSNASDMSWKASLSYPFHLLNCPYNCPMWKYCGHDTPNDIYRVNFFRINELVPTSTCTSSTCEYLAWSPTDVNPPAFHEPTKFGYILLQFDPPSNE